MAITSGISNLGLKPGVCTSSSRPTNPYEGMMIFETDTNRVLVYDNSSWVMIADTDTPPALELVKTQTVGSAVSSVTVTNAFSATYDDYLIKWSGGTMTDNTNIYMRIGSITTGYYGSLLYGSYAGGGAQQAGNNGDPWWSWSGGGYAGGANLHVDIQAPFLSKETQITARIRYSTVYGTYTGHISNSTSCTDFNINAWSGTMTGGTIRVYGYRNSI